MKMWNPCPEICYNKDEKGCCKSKHCTNNSLGNYVESNRTLSREDAEKAVKEAADD